MKVLIVEDDFVSQRLLQKLLSDYAQCEVAVNGQDAVDAFEVSVAQQEPYDLICLDIMMPIMDGQEVLKVIRRREKELGVDPKHEVKVVMTTALDTPKDVIEAYYRGGCNGYLVKPIEKKKLLGVLREHCLIK